VLISVPIPHARDAIVRVVQIVPSSQPPLHLHTVLPPPRTPVLRRRVALPVPPSLPILHRPCHPWDFSLQIRVILLQDLAECVRKLMILLPNLEATVPARTHHAHPHLRWLRERLLPLRLLTRHEPLPQSSHPNASHRPRTHLCLPHLPQNRVTLDPVLHNHPRIRLRNSSAHAAILFDSVRFFYIILFNLEAWKGIVLTLPLPLRAGVPGGVCRGAYPEEGPAPRPAGSSLASWATGAARAGSRALRYSHQIANPTRHQQLARYLSVGLSVGAPNPHLKWWLERNRHIAALVATGPQDALGDAGLPSKARRARGDEGKWQDAGFRNPALPHLVLRCSTLGMTSERKTR